MIRYVWIFYTVFVLALTFSIAVSVVYQNGPYDRRTGVAAVLLFGGLFWLLVVLSPLRR